jgi:NAD(P)-dependent dehydrogenase (short-subunit alcohol dehydrogenase family)
LIVEYEAACDRICDNIASLLVDMGSRPTVRATFAAARATHGIADALHHAAGAPEDGRWYDALADLETFVNIYDAGVQPSPPAALSELRAFLDENADFVTDIRRKAS